MVFMLKKASLARDFTIFSIIILITVAVVSICVGLIVHYSYYNQQESKIASKANILDRELADDFNIVTHYARFLGNKIAQHGNQDEEYIRQIFSNEAYYDPNNENIWTKFGWIRPDKKLLLFSKNSIEEKDISARTFLNETPFAPGKIKFSAPALGILSNQWILPAGVGITNKNREFLGTVNTGFHLERLAKKLDFMFDRKDLVFMLFDENIKFILSSDNIGFSYLKTLPPENFVQRIKSNIEEAKLDKGLLLEPIEYGQFEFTYFKHSELYPFYFVIGENIKIANSAYWQITFPRIAELSLMGILFIILLYYFRKYIVKPIILLSDSAKKIVEGDLNPVIYHEQYQEVRLLAEQLKEIQKTKIELIQAKNKVDAANRNLEEKVKERTNDLEKALAIKTEFLNNISHEVRTPVQGITTISQGLVKDWKNQSDDKNFSLASAVASNSRRLFSLVSNLLDLSIFNEDKMYFNFQNIDIIKLIDDIILECETLYLPGKKIKIKFIDRPETAILKVDPEKITQVLRNLLTNSIKFMDKGNIEIKVSSDESSQYIVTIKDEGINVPEQELDKIFSPFIRSSTTKEKISGAGLGLAISKKIIDGHNGKIWAINNPNKGLIISFSLPKNQIISSRNELNNSTAKAAKILMIDDELTCQMSMEILLSNTGYVLFSAYGGVEGLEYLKKNYKEIDLILLDLMMPDMYGLNVLSEIKSKPELSHIPVIIQSGTNDNKEVEKGFSLGASEYVRKPYQRQQIIDAINNCLVL